MDTEKTKKYIEDNFEKVFVESLAGFVRISNLTPSFDSEFHSNGLIQDAVKYVKDFAAVINIEGLEFHCHEEEGIPPMAVIVYPGNGKKNVMLYGHLDKQPHMDGWKEGTGPCTPTIIGDKMYGRGSTDDGYVSFATLLAIKNAIEQGVELPRIAIVLETDEESGSKSLVYLLEKCRKWIGTPDLCISCDSGALNYETLWFTSSLRGMLGFNLKVSVAENAVHSGMSGGVLPESFRVLNRLLDRLENPETLKMERFEVEIPEQYIEEAKVATSIIGNKMYEDFKMTEGTRPIQDGNLSEMYLNMNWRPCLAVTGADGLPSLDKAGNVVRAYTTVRIKMRLPSTLDSKEAAKECVKILTEDTPFGAKVEIQELMNGDGWVMKDLRPDTQEIIENATQQFYGQSVGKYGVGGSIPFMKILGDIYTEAEVIALGVCGGDANIHAPNETIDLPYVKKLICVLSHTLVDFGNNNLLG